MKWKSRSLARSPYFGSDIWFMRIPATGQSLHFSSHSFLGLTFTGSWRGLLIVHNYLFLPYSFYARASNFYTPFNGNCNVWRKDIATLLDAPTARLTPSHTYRGVIEMSFKHEKETTIVFGIDTFQIAQALLLFALTLNSDLPWWKWVLFILNYAGLDFSVSKKVKSTRTKD